jgi:hypothetical protein
MRCRSEESALCSIQAVFRRVFIHNLVPSLSGGHVTSTLDFATTILNLATTILNLATTILDFAIIILDFKKATRSCVRTCMRILKILS